ncbi:MAG TPA: pilus assembly protein PilP [Nitrospira sp.]|nr:pilus assembly protein PilP [Nitrospira sp.]
MKKSQVQCGLLAAVVGLIWVWTGAAQAEPPLVQNQINPMRQDSIKMTSVGEVPRAAGSPPEVPVSSQAPQMLSQLPVPEVAVGTGYDPSGRRDPFAPIVQELQVDRNDPNLPPLQRVTLSELNLIAIVWGSYGYTAMVQTPEGHGYSVRRGTRIGQNNGVVSAITERGIIVQERFTDVYGKKQEREHVKLLHPKEGSE